MKTYRTLQIIAVAAFCLTVSAAEPEDGFTAMFNGEDLSGWEGKPGGWWVEDGAITSESTAEKPCVKHHYLYWNEGQPGDFVLRFKFKLAGGNSGVQIRSEERPEFDTWGYQADMDAEGEWTGCLFQHDRGGVVMRGFKAAIARDGSREEERFADPAELVKAVRIGDWNDYEVVAKGNRIALSINGRLMCEVEDNDGKYSRAKGLIALQMHPGPPMKVQFKDLRIKVMDKAEERSLRLR